MKWREETIGDARLILGDCLEILPTLGKVDAVVTSPPYAKQRAPQYGGISEASYPEWTLEWMEAARALLDQDSCIFINIREHVTGGILSDYVLRTRLLVRTRWHECDELIWIKPDGPPVGDPARPRRSWERVLWFCPSSRPRCFPKANGRHSDRLGMIVKETSNCRDWTHGLEDEIYSGISRCPDYFTFSVRLNPDYSGHPATFPPQVPAWIANLSTQEGETIIDPFMGSGTTGVACARLGRRFIGIEIEEKYFNIACRRIDEAQRQARLFDTPTPKPQQLALLETLR